MRLLCANGKEEGALWAGAQIGADGRGDVTAVCARAGQHFVVADHVDARVLMRRQVFDAAERRFIAVRAQGARDVPFGIGEGKTAVGQAEHAAAVRVLAGQKSGAARRAGRRGGESVAKEHALIGQAQQIWRGHGVAVGFDETAAVVGMEEDYIGGLHGVHWRASPLLVDGSNSKSCGPVYQFANSSITRALSPDAAYG